MTIKHTCPTDVIQSLQIRLDEQQARCERLQSELSIFYSAPPADVALWLTTHRTASDASAIAAALNQHNAGQRMKARTLTQTTEAQ